MKKNIFLFLIFLLNVSPASGQEEKEVKWDFGADLNFYFLTDDFFMLPVLRADNNKVHLETRYNYEDMQTFSAWIGYNISGGNNLEYLITPMIGGVTGNTDGIAPGLELTLGYKKFELYSESEHLFDLEDKENNFYYNWSDLTYSPKENWWFGLSGQRTRLYQTDLEIQRGLLLGGSVKKFEMTCYLYNLFFDDPFFLLAVSMNF